MTTVDPAFSECDFTVAIEDAYVIVRDGSSDPRIIKASFFSKNRVEISDRIKSSFKWDDPTGQSPFVTMVFYGAHDSCKTKLGEISSGPLLMSAPRRKLSGNIMAMSSRTNKKNDNYPLDSQETSTNFNVLKRYLDSISNRLEYLSKQFIERFDHIDDTLSNHTMTNNSFRDPSMNITDYAMTEMANVRKDPKWRKRIKSMVWPGLTEGQLEEVKRELLKGNKSASKTAIAISKIIYGDKLKTHILGDKGKLVRAPREGERALVISIDDENLFRGTVKTHSVSAH
uniref:Uncharacterized protein n=1 Tax=Tetranychus urticae TaxID=32264 RepID=T1KTX9_TETUR